MIPKKIHYCWFGKNAKPKLIVDCINSWRKMCPDYEIIEWNEDNFDFNLFDYTKEAYAQKKWAFVSDVARLFILYNEGGIYLDTDVQLIKSLEQSRNCDLFISSEDNKKIATGLGIGCTKGNKYIKKMLDDYVNIHFVNNGKLDMTPCPIRNTKSIEELLKNFDLNKYGKYENVIYYPREYFNPKNEVTDKLEVTNNTIGIHLGMATWQKKSVIFTYKIRNIIKRILGEKIVRKIKKGR